MADPTTPGPPVPLKLDAADLLDWMEVAYHVAPTTVIVLSIFFVGYVTGIGTVWLWERHDRARIRELAEWLRSLR